METNSKEAPSKKELQENDEEELIESRNIVTDFGTLEIFQEKTKTITIDIPTGEKTTYILKKDPHVRNFKKDFYLDHCEGVLNPDENFKLEITYKPTIASLKVLEVYEYIDSNFEIIKISLTGKAIGPHCTISSKKLKFYKTPTKQITDGTVEITNDSKVMVYFKINEINGDIFSIFPLEGVLAPAAHQHIGVKFSPNRRGLFARKIFILVWNSEPLVLDLIGYCDKKLITLDGIKHYNYPPDLTFGFGAFLNDSLLLRENVPPFSLSSNYLDFGCVLVKGQGPRTQVTSMTNHLKSSIYVEWESGSGSFKISPKSTKIFANTSVQFEIEFNPKENYNIYSETLLGQVYWDSEKVSSSELARTCLPLTCEIRAQGHSFPENEGRIAHIEVLPEVVYLQPCLPGGTANSTFLLKNKCHLPVMYKIIPPQKTKMTVKPMLGIFREFEIITIQLKTEPAKIKPYIEEWKVVINGRDDKEIKFYIHGETVIPSLEIGKKNRIEAGPVQEGSKKEVSAMMRNTTYLPVNFKFLLKDDSFLSIIPMEGILQANKALQLKLTITGSQCAPLTEKITCAMRILDGNGAIVGDVYEMTAEIISVCSYGQLCAFPSTEEFESLPFGTRLTSKFEAINFGETDIYFQACQCGENYHDETFRIKPWFGEVKAKSCMSFHINGIISQVGKQVLEFGYYNRMVRDSPLVTGTPIKIFELTYFSEFPTVQVEEIVEHNFCHLFGKAHFYDEYLQISRFNHVLRLLGNEHPTEKLYFRLPECEVGDKEYFITLALKNIRDYETEVVVKRKKICNCALSEQSGAGLTQRKKGYNCPHRETLTLEMSATKFLPHGTRFLTIKAKYTIPGKTKMCYTMCLSNNRFIELYFNIFAIPPETTRLSYYSENFAMQLKNVYLGTRVAPVQMFWLYNNTSQLLDLEINVEEVERMCRIDGFKVLEILNPVDQMLPYSSKPILIKFHPIEAKKYCIEIEIKYQNPRQETYSKMFSIEGTGTMELKKPLGSEQEDEMPKFTTSIGDVPVSLSTERLDALVLPVWNKTTQLIFIKNNYRRETIQYIWGTVKIDNIIEITAEPSYGLLNPKEIHPILIIIKSLAEPCNASLLLTCEIINYTEIVKNRITKEKYKEAQKRIDIFLSEGKVYPFKPVENPIIVHPIPQPIYLSININITTVHTKDLDTFLDPQVQTQHYPSESLESISRSLLKKYYPNEYRRNTYPDRETNWATIDSNRWTIFCRILEEMIGDVLFSETFKRCVLESATGPFHYYTEFVMDDRQIITSKQSKTPLSKQDIADFRKKEVQHFLKQPKLGDLTNIFYNLIYDGLLMMVKCNKPSYDIKKLNEEIEKSLYTCKNKACLCNKTEE